MNTPTVIEIRPLICECGHAQNDHRMARTPPTQPVRFGYCFECDCRHFTPAAPRVASAGIVPVEARADVELVDRMRRNLEGT